MITHEDIKEIKKVIDDRYVQIADCDSVQEAFNKKFANDDKRIDLMALDIKQMRKETKSSLKFNNWLTSAVLGVIVTGLITFLFLNFGR